jgi:glutamine synthetase
MQAGDTPGPAAEPGTGPVPDPGLGPVVLDEVERAGRMRRAAAVAEQLRTQDISMVALCWVDNAGITRVKTVPVSRLEYAAGWGIGMSPVFDVFLVSDDITSSAVIGGPSGDLRLVPDLDAVTRLAAQPGWAMAPVGRYTQEGRVYAACQRSFARRMAARAAEAGFELRASFEIEWVAGTDDNGVFTPACTGPAYGMTRVIELSEYSRQVTEALDSEGLAVQQFHPEYAAGQLEVSLAATGPVAAADRALLARQTIRAVSANFGYLASFAPAVAPGTVGNGGHVHLSAWRDGRNLFAGGDGRYGLTRDGEAFAAGILAALPELAGIGMPSVASYLRLVPSHWAGIYQCWGRENREAAVRLVTGSAGQQADAANIEIKCFDGAANPYLAVGSLIAAGLAGAESGAALPAEAHGDPASWPPGLLEERGVQRLPQDLGAAIAHLEGSALLRDALGEALFEAVLAVRRGELKLFSGTSPEDVAARTRWRW